MHFVPAVLLVVGSAVAANWGPDVAVDTGPVSAFGVSADSTGRLWAATAAGRRLRLFSSGDAGASWQLILEHAADAAVSQVELAVGWGGRSAVYLAFLTAENGGDLWLLRLDWGDSVAVMLPIAVGPDTIDDFSFAIDRCRYYYLYCLTANEHRPGLTGFFSRSSDFGESWEPGQSWWNAHDPQLVCLAGASVHCVWRFAQDPTQIHHQFSRRYGASGSWEPHRVITRGGYFRWEPRLAATDTVPERLAQLWLVYTQGWRDSGRTDVRLRTSGNDRPAWGEETNWSDPYRDEWFADIVADRWTRNGMVSMVYNRGGRGPDDSTAVYWRWAAAWQPAWWSAGQPVSDRRVCATLPACRPRLLYAPRTPLALPLVFFAGWDSAGARGLFCDAPWFAGTVTPAASAVLVRDRLQLEFAVPAPGRYDAAAYDVLGRCVWRNLAVAASDRLRVEWSCQSFPPGRYTVVVRGPGMCERRTVAVAR